MAELRGARTVVLAEWSARRDDVEACMRAKDEKEVRARLVPRMSARGTADEDALPPPEPEPEEEPLSSAVGGDCGGGGIMGI